jgi:hypothetical protein
VARSCALRPRSTSSSSELTARSARSSASTPSGVLGGGGGLAAAPLMTVAMSDVPAADTGIASALVNLSMYVPGAVGLAVVGALAADQTRTLTAHGEPFADALVGGYQLGLLVCAGCIAAALVVALSVLRPAREPAESVS